MRILNLIVLGAIVAATCGVAPESVKAQDQAPVKSDLLLRVKGPVSIGPVDTMGTVLHDDDFIFASHLVF